ncbi:NeuD/PglB/VioB family sugar acetyltransferase [Lewinella sp. IMCC34183]|uniref:NeuD/PglB/VioB family sugar acetyltransferase n=1 Tax=Lewinella sp. IMCC34183 TaxID=2248762 RepID=UPI000E23DB3F|nr:NeuD/PglB/VioB family sugar acetyltransferase [Lewinella sp. IMCC34183]
MAADQSVNVVVPKETVSDDFYRVTELNFASGDRVAEGDTIGALETSKADFELDAPADGYIHYMVAEGEDIAAGEVFARITPQKEMSAPDQPAPDSPTGTANAAPRGNVRVSAAAREMMKERGLEASDFPGLSLITTRDILGNGTPAGRPRTDVPRVMASPQNATYDAQSVIIIGEKGHAGACLDLLQHQPGLRCVGFIGTEDSPSEAYGLPILGTNDDLPDLFTKHGIRQAVIGIGALANPRARSRIYEMLTGLGFTVPNLIHPRATIERSVSMGQGNQVFAGAIVGSNVTVGNNCIINSGAIVSHDCVLDDNAHLTPGSTLAGMVSIGKNSVVGMNSNVYLGVSIGAGQLVNNGENVFKDLADK